MRKHNFLFVFFADQGSLSQPRSQGSLLPVPTERERERERERETLVGSGHVVPEQNGFRRFHRSHNDRKGKIDLLSLQL